jgi:hypothetical protein
MFLLVVFKCRFRNAIVSFLEVLLQWATESILIVSLADHPAAINAL